MWDCLASSPRYNHSHIEFLNIQNTLVEGNSLKCISGVMEVEAIEILKQFYDQENMSGERKLSISNLQPRNIKER